MPRMPDTGALPWPMPVPLSRTRSVTASGSAASDTVTCVQPEWRTALVSASCAMR